MFTSPNYYKTFIFSLAISSFYSWHKSQNKEVSDHYVDVFMSPYMFKDELSVNSDEIVILYYEMVINTSNS